MFVAAAAEDNNTRVLFERVLSSGALPPDKSRLAMFLLLLLTYHLSKKYVLKNYYVTWFLYLVKTSTKCIL